MTTTAARTADAILSCADQHPAGADLAGRDRLIAFLGAEIVSAEQVEARALAREAAERRAARLRFLLALALAVAITLATVAVLP